MMSEVYEVGRKSFEDMTEMLLNNKNIKLTLEKIYDDRKNIYSLANYKIDCNNLTTISIVNKIAKLYEDN